MITLRMLVTLISVFCIIVETSNAQEFKQIDINNTYPWCIVAYDSLERSPVDRIQMLTDLGFKKYAYDWREKHLDDTYTELNLAAQNDIEIISVWLWLNAKRDRPDQLSSANQRIFKIVERLNLKTTFWVSLSENFFEDQDQEQSVKVATEMVEFITRKAHKINCKVALYNHRGWFGNPYNQLEIINALPDLKLSLVYNFHHAHNSIKDFPNIVRAIQPYLSAVNLNGMKLEGEKILTIGKGDYEKEMINELMKSGFSGPWGIMGHVDDADVRNVLEQNLEGLKKLQYM